MMNKSNTPNKSGTTFQKVASIVLSLGLLLTTGASLMNLARFYFKIDATPNTPIALVITAVATIVLFVLLLVVENWDVIVKKLNIEENNVDRLARNLDDTMLKLKKEQANLYDRRVKAKNRLSTIEAQILDIEKILEKNKGA